MRLTQRLEELRDDVTYAFRQMRATPGFTIVAALTLALGIGANSAIFALADATFLRPLPFTTPPDRLVMLWERYPNGYLSQVTPPDYYDWATQNRTFDAMAAFTGDNAALIGADGLPEQVRSQLVSARFFDVLGVTPIAGRTFLQSDAAAPAVVVLSEAFWRRRFGADPTIVGRSIVVGEQPRTVIGIVPDRFHVVPATISNAGSEPPQLWILFNTTSGGGPAMRRAHFLYVIGRIKAGVSMAAAQQDLTAIGARNAELFPDTNKGHDPTLQPMREALVGSEMRVTSLLLLGVVGFVLLMCCANMANLFLARTNARARELAVRSALGATRGRVMAQLLTESLVLAVLGGTIGAGSRRRDPSCCARDGSAGPLAQRRVARLRRTNPAVLRGDVSAGGSDVRARAGVAVHGSIDDAVAGQRPPHDGSRRVPSQRARRRRSGGSRPRAVRCGVAAAQSDRARERGCRLSRARTC